MLKELFGYSLEMDLLLGREMLKNSWVLKYGKI